MVESKQLRDSSGTLIDPETRNGQAVNEYASVSVANSTITDIVSYTVTTGYTLQVFDYGGAHWAGMAAGKNFKLYLEVDGSIIRAHRIDCNTVVGHALPTIEGHSTKGIEVASAKVVKVQAEHNAGANRDVRGWLSGREF